MKLEPKYFIKLRNPYGGLYKYVLKEEDKKKEGAILLLDEKEPHKEFKAKEIVVHTDEDKEYIRVEIIDEEDRTILYPKLEYVEFK